MKNKAVIVVASVVGLGAVAFILYKVFASGGASDSADSGAPVQSSAQGASGAGAGSVASLVTSGAAHTAAKPPAGASGSGASTTTAAGGKPPPEPISGPASAPLSNVGLFDSKLWYKS